jgi:hypothetical protein
MVLAVLGLVIGTLLGAQAMLKNQRLRQVGADATKYLIAMNQFKLQYSYFAGDFPTATSVWGRADGGVPVTSNCASPNANASAVGSKATCNGDGNGSIDATVSPTFNHETYRAWQHLSAAGLIEGQFTGVSNGVASSYITLGSNAPKGAYEQTGYAWSFGLNLVNSAVAADTNYYDGDYSQALIFGKAGNIANPGSGLGAPALSPTQLYELDAKLDDVLPSTGNVRSLKPTAALTPNCVTGAAYNTTLDSEACVAIFMPTLAGNNNR